MTVRKVDHQLYLNGLKVIEGHDKDYVMIGPTEDMTPAFTHLVKGNDRVTLVLPQRGGDYIEADLDPKKVHRLCDKCHRNSQPQPDAAGNYAEGFPKSSCVPCVLRGVRAEIKTVQTQIKDRKGQLTHYRKLFRLSTRRKGIDTDMRDLVLALDGPTLMRNMVEATEGLVQRTQDRLAVLKDLRDELKG
jgi:hypothetical protein